MHAEDLSDCAKYRSRFAAVWAEGFVDKFMELEEKYGPVTDADGQQAAEQEQVRPVPLHVWGGDINQARQGGCGNQGPMMGTLPEGR